MAASPAVATHLKLDAFYFVKRHAFYLMPVLGILVGVSLLSSDSIRKMALLFYIGCIILLILTPFLGSEIKGARRWIGMGMFSIQPSEFIKPVLAVIVAWMLAEKKNDNNFSGYSYVALFYGIVVFLLVMQPDMGMTVLITSVTFCQLFIAGLPILWIFIAIAAACAGLIGSYFTFSHVHQRIDRFLDPSSGDKYTDRYQVNQSIEAFVNGGIFGRGPGEGTVKTHLPDAHADFIFAVAGEEFGLLLCTSILVMFAFIVVRSISRLFMEESLFRILAVSGLILQFGVQALINMASTVNLIPTKGMTLPFISYGGSSMMALALTMGIVLALTRKRYDICHEI
jgi:cell division protein FtsW